MVGVRLDQEVEQAVVAQSPRHSHTCPPPLWTYSSPHSPRYTLHRTRSNSRWPFSVKPCHRDKAVSPQTQQWHLRHKTTPGVAGGCRWELLMVLLAVQVDLGELEDLVAVVVVVAAMGQPQMN
jgi:hypothetical protein